jgi:hypothetical protein
MRTKRHKAIDDCVSLCELQLLLKVNERVREVECLQAQSLKQQIILKTFFF